MRIEEAIEILEEANRRAPFLSPLSRAEKLGIEALQRCRDNYLNPQRADFRRLPSETKE